MSANSNVANIAGVILTGLAIGLAGYLSIRGMPIPDWLAIFIGGGGGATAASISHTQGQKVAASLFAATQAQAKTTPAPEPAAAPPAETGGTNG